MKKSILILLLILVLTNFVLSQELELYNRSVNNSEILKNASQSINERINQVFKNDLTIPLYLDKPAKILFGVKEGDDFNIHILLIMVSFFVFFLVICYESSTLFIQSKGIAGLVFAAAFTGILSWTGSFKKAAYALIGLTDKLFIIRSSRIIEILAAIVLLFVFYSLFTRFVKHVKEGKKYAEAEDQGIEVGTHTATVRAQAKLERK